MKTKAQRVDIVLTPISGFSPLLPYLISFLFAPGWFASGWPGKNYRCGSRISNNGRNGNNRKEEQEEQEKASQGPHHFE